MSLEGHCKREHYNKHNSQLEVNKQVRIQFAVADNCDYKGISTDIYQHKILCFTSDSEYIILNKTYDMLRSNMKGCPQSIPKEQKKKEIL